MRVPILAAAAAISFILGCCDAAAERWTDIVGAREGAQSSARCPALSNLVGLEVYSRDDIDAVRPICASALAAYGQEKTAGALENAAAYGEPIGGVAAGANLTVLRCPPEAPIVTGAEIDTEDDATTAVNGVRLECGVAGANPIANLVRGGAFAAPVYETPGMSFSGRGAGTASCPRSFGAYVAVGVHIWSGGDWIRGIGFACDDPGFVAKSVGRTKPKPPVGLTAGAAMGPSASSIARCERYAHAAAAAAVEARNLGCGFSGGRWTTEYDRHFEWCSGLNGDQTTPATEEAARTEMLAECRNRSGDQ